jgi:hypothetical protein
LGITFIGFNTPSDHIIQRLPNSTPLEYSTTLPSYSLLKVLSSRLSSTLSLEL